MEPIDIIKYFAREGTVIVQAPVSFLTAVTIVGGLIWWYFHRHYAERFAILRQQIANLEQQVAFHKDVAEQGNQGGGRFSLPGVFIVQHLEHAFYWRQGQEEMKPFHPAITVPRGVEIILRIMVRITAPSLLVEYVDLAVMNQRLRSNWESRMDESVPYYEQYVYVNLPQGVNAGHHTVKLIAGSSDREQSSIAFDIDVPHV